MSSKHERVLKDNKKVNKLTAGFEPATTALGGQHSSSELREQVNFLELIDL